MARKGQVIIMLERRKVAAAMRLRFFD